MLLDNLSGEGKKTGMKENKTTHRGGETRLWATGQKRTEAQWKPQALRGAGRGTTPGASALGKEKWARCAGRGHGGDRREGNRRAQKGRR